MSAAAPAPNAARRPFQDLLQLQADTYELSYTCAPETLLTAELKLRGITRELRQYGGANLSKYFLSLNDKDGNQIQSGSRTSWDISCFKIRMKYDEQDTETGWTEARPLQQVFVWPDVPSDGRSSWEAAPPAAPAVAPAVAPPVGENAASTDPKTFLAEHAGKMISFLPAGDLTTATARMYVKASPTKENPLAVTQLFDPTNFQWLSKSKVVTLTTDTEAANQGTSTIAAQPQSLDVDNNSIYIGELVQIFTDSNEKFDKMRDEYKNTLQNDELKNKADEYCKRKSMVDSINPFLCKTRSISFAKKQLSITMDNYEQFEQLVDENAQSYKDVVNAAFEPNVTLMLRQGNPEERNKNKVMLMTLADQQYSLAEESISELADIITKRADKTLESTSSEAMKAINDVKKQMDSGKLRNTPATSMRENANLFASYSSDGSSGGISELLRKNANDEAGFVDVIYVVNAQACDLSSKGFKTHAKESNTSKTLNPLLTYAGAMQAFMMGYRLMNDVQKFISKKEANDPAIGRPLGARPFRFYCSPLPRSMETASLLSCAYSQARDKVDIQDKTVLLHFMSGLMHNPEMPLRVGNTFLDYLENLLMDKQQPELTEKDKKNLATLCRYLGNKRSSPDSGDTKSSIRAEAATNLMASVCNSDGLTQTMHYGTELAGLGAGLVFTYFFGASLAATVGIPTATETMLGAAAKGAGLFATRVGLAQAAGETTKGMLRAGGRRLHRFARSPRFSSPSGDSELSKKGSDDVVAQFNAMDRTMQKLENDQNIESVIKANFEKAPEMSDQAEREQRIAMFKELIQNEVKEEAEAQVEDAKKQAKEGYASWSVWAIGGMLKQALPSLFETGISWFQSEAAKTAAKNQEELIKQQRKDIEAKAAYKRFKLMAQAKQTVWLSRCIDILERRADSIIENRLESGDMTIKRICPIGESQRGMFVTHTYQYLSRIWEEDATNTNNELATSRNASDRYAKFLNMYFQGGLNIDTNTVTMRPEVNKTAGIRGGKGSGGEFDYHNQNSTVENFTFVDNCCTDRSDSKVCEVTESGAERSQGREFMHNFAMGWHNENLNALSRNNPNLRLPVHVVTVPSGFLQDEIIPMCEVDAGSYNHVNGKIQDPAFPFHSCTAVWVRHNALNPTQPAKIVKTWTSHVRPGTAQSLTPSPCCVLHGGCADVGEDGAASCGLFRRLFEERNPAVTKMPQFVRCSYGESNEENQGADHTDFLRDKEGKGAAHTCRFCAVPDIAKQYDAETSEDADGAGWQGRLQCSEECQLDSRNTGDLRAQARDVVQRQLSELYTKNQEDANQENRSSENPLSEENVKQSEEIAKEWDRATYKADGRVDTITGFTAILEQQAGINKRVQNERSAFGE